MIGHDWVARLEMVLAKAWNKGAKEIDALESKSFSFRKYPSWYNLLEWLLRKLKMG